jgi:hypothetical protein
MIRIDDLTYISIEDIPSTTKQWDTIFNSIPKNKAIVIAKSEASPDVVRQAIKRRHRKGKFLNLKMISRTVNGVVTSYVINEVGDKP